MSWYSGRFHTGNKQCWAASDDHRNYKFICFVISFGTLKYRTLRKPSQPEVDKQTTFIFVRQVNIKVVVTCLCPPAWLGDQWNILMIYFSVHSMWFYNSYSYYLDIHITSWQSECRDLVRWPCLCNHICVPFKGELCKSGCYASSWECDFFFSSKVQEKAINKAVDNIIYHIWCCNMYICVILPFIN